MNTGSIFWGWPNDAPVTPGGDESGRRKREGRPVGGPTVPAIKKSFRNLRKLLPFYLCRSIALAFSASSSRTTTCAGMVPMG